MGTTNIRRRKSPRTPHADPTHPHSVPILGAEDEADQTPDQPFAEGATDTVDVDLRHRMISEAAFRRATERGFTDGYDVEDWLQAEAEVDHVLLNRGKRDTD